MPTNRRWIIFVTILMELSLIRYYNLLQPHRFFLNHLTLIHIITSNIRVINFQKRWILKYFYLILPHLFFLDHRKSIRSLIKFVLLSPQKLRLLNNLILHFHLLPQLLHLLLIETYHFILGQLLIQIFFLFIQ